MEVMTKKNMKRKDKKITKFSVYNSMNFALLVIFEQTNSKNKQANKQKCREQRSINIVKGMFKDSITYTNKIASEMIKIKLSKLVSKLMNAI